MQSGNFNNISTVNGSEISRCTEKFRLQMGLLSREIFQYHGYYSGKIFLQSGKKGNNIPLPNSKVLATVLSPALIRYNLWEYVCTQLEKTEKNASLLRNIEKL